MKPRRPQRREGEPRGGARPETFVVVKFRDEVEAPYSDDLLRVADQYGLEALRTSLDAYPGCTLRRLYTSVDPDAIRALVARAQPANAQRLPNLLAWYRITCGPRTDPESLARALSALPFVEQAYVELPVSEPMVDPSDDPYSTMQGYLDPAPDGIDARHAWTVPGGNGAGIAFIDLESGWKVDHEDLSAHAPKRIFGENKTTADSHEHGTAVLGEVVGVDNAVGVVGIAPGVASVRLTSWFDGVNATTKHVADALLAAIAVLGFGDVVVLEVHRGQNPAYRPTEVDPADFAAIQLATSLGIVVVEAAGNGDFDLDTYTDAMGGKVLNRTSPAFRDSGAIMVGAARSDVPHDRISSAYTGFWGSNHGSRLDCYAWGENVVTCGYGTLAPTPPGSPVPADYTATFGGTSSASAIVAGAALAVQGAAASAQPPFRLSPAQMRAILASHGTPQGPNVAGNIGVMPDLLTILDDVLELRPDVYIRDNPLDTGQQPQTGSLSSSPDIILRPVAEADPEAAFGEGSGNEDSTVLGAEAVPGQDNYVYVRLKNRGGSNAAGVSVTVYWSPVASLVTPDLWTPIGTLPGLAVPTGNTLQVLPALVWPAADIPGPGHYCFVGIVDHPADPAPSIPSLLNFDNFRAVIRNNNGVTWRNFNVVDLGPGAGGDQLGGGGAPVPGASPLPFILPGAPDRAWRMDIEIERHLPAGAQLVLEGPPALPAILGAPPNWVRVEDRRRTSLIRIPPRRLVRFPKVRLARGARHQCRLWVHIPDARPRQRYHVAVRHTFEGEEVGRVAWLLRVPAPARR